MKSNVVKMRCKQGFTLIELLVVVLIIGILAAVALPQYNKAVKKARGTEALEAANALEKAISAYYLEHGTYVGMSPDNLSITIPELQHFKYAVGSGCGSNGSNNFTAEYNDEQGPTASSFVQVICNPDIFSLKVAFNKGTIIRACGPTEEICKQYFNKCTWGPAGCRLDLE